jgi:hypothetical protein
VSVALTVCLSSGLAAQDNSLTVPDRSFAATDLRRLWPTPSTTGWPPATGVQRGSLPVEASLGVAQPAPRGSSRDSLKNGAIIGAVAGAAALGALGALICHLYQEEGGPSCLPDTLRVAAIGAGVGLGAGVVVDAALSRNAGVRVRLAVSF